MGIFRVLLLAPNKRIKCSGLSFTPFVSASHTDAERHYFGKDHPFPCESRSLSHGNTRASLHCGPRSRITFTLKSPSGLFKVSYLGSVRAVTNQWGSPLYMFDYDVFGTPLQDRPERFRHGFTGKEFDSWTGLYNYGFRDYASLYGRFTTVDPIQDGHNWYAYVNSDPVSWLDPWGLEPCKQESGEDKKKKETGRVVNKTGDIILIKPEHDEDPYTLLKPGEIYQGNIDGIIFADGTVKKTNGTSKYVAKQTRSGEYKVSGGKIIDFFANLVKAERNTVYVELKSQGYDPASVGMGWENVYMTYHYDIDSEDFLISWLNTEKKLDSDNDKSTVETSFVPIPFGRSNQKMPRQLILEQWGGLVRNGGQ